MRRFQRLHEPRCSPVAQLEVPLEQTDARSLGADNDLDSALEEFILLVYHEVLGWRGRLFSKLLEIRGILIPVKRTPDHQNAPWRLHPLAGRTA